MSSNRPPGSAGSERGSASVWTLLAVTCLLAGTVAGLALVDVTLARHRAAAAADLAALAAAGAELPFQPAGPAPCAAAARVAARNAATLVLCRKAGDGSVTVIVEVTPGPLVRRWATGVSGVRAVARAGR